jgi:chromatin modification-related protein VID21
VLATKTRDRRRRSVPTVIFGKQPKKSKPTDDGAVVASQQRPGQIPSDDYFTPLFIEGFTRQSTWMKPIEKLINQAHKTISTSDQYISILDHQACKILRRVYHLQQHDKWSLRQPVRCPEPTRPASHMDVLLQEMKWMRTDFREERKWKRAVARNLAHACAEWVHSGPTERLALQVNAVIPPRPVDGEATNAGRSDVVDEAVPDLVHTDSPTENDDENLENLIDCVAPSAIFALPDDEVVFELHPSKTADLLLENLPMHSSPLKVPKFDVSGTEYDPDANWKRPAVPLSKYVEGEMAMASNGPPRKRRRYDYLAEDDDDNDEVIFGTEPDSGAELQAENSRVALFSPEMKGIRDRLHAGHQFRPPTEHPMPPQSFFESRTASQWTLAEDEQLKSLVRECSYNWSLISAMASTPSAFASGAERRTPWECFERWVSLGSLEGLPNDMARTPYFKAYQARIDAAQRVIAQQNQNAQQQVGPNGAVTPVSRRRPTTSIRVERRRNQKHLALIDAMRKLAKKREATAQKAQQAANLAAMRKANEVPRQQIQNKTPRDYSIMRWERDQALAERMAAYAIRQADANARRLVSAL